MTKIALILILASLLVGACFFLIQKEPEPVLVKKDLAPYVSSIAFAARDVERGAIIKAEDIMAREREANEVPDGAAFAKQPIGKRARRGISKGYMVSQYDLDPYPPGLRTRCVRLTRPVQRGQVILADAVEVAEISSEKLPSTEPIDDTSEAIRRIAKTNLERGHWLSASDLDASE